LATWIDVTDEDAPTTPLMTFFCDLLQLHSSVSASMLLMEPATEKEEQQ
jgi:hypothetical protein